jgi:hypothetical protein
MPIILVLTLQAASAPPPARVEAIAFDLGDYRPSPQGSSGCGRAEPSEILVCGLRERAGDYPLEEQQRRYAGRPLRAETMIGGNVQLRAFVDSATMPNGEVSNRVMVGIRMPF